MHFLKPQVQFKTIIQYPQKFTSPTLLEKEDEVFDVDKIFNINSFKAKFK